MNFDELKDRRGQMNAKFDAMESYCGVSSDDGIAMWVADMDFDAAPCIRDTLRAQADRGFLGYIGDQDSVGDAIAGWMDRKHGWTISRDWIRYTHGVVAAYSHVLDAFSDPGDEVVLFTPVYHAFFLKAAAMGRKICQAPLVLQDGQYHMDLSALAGQLDGRQKIVCFCSPHNPGGRLWSETEIAALAAFCKEHGLLLLSDEIHMDLTFPGARHIPTARVAPADNLVTITAASKGFNIAGGETGFAIIEDADLRARYDISHKNRGGTPNRFGMVMTKSAFTDGDAWSDAVRAYLAENFALWRDRIDALPGISVMDMNATYLSWVDFSGTGMEPAEHTSRLHEAGIGMNAGEGFGKGGESWHRFNLAMPRARLEDAISRIETAFADLQ